jgi:methionyl-tRNA synthetase
MYAKAREAMDRQGIKHYLDAVWTVVADANRYFAGEEPWAKGKTDPKRRDTILYVTAEVVRQVAILAQPATPAGANRLLDGLGQGAEARTFAALGEKARLRPGTVVPPPAGAFPRYVDPEDAASEPKGKKPKQKG